MQPMRHLLAVPSSSGEGTHRIAVEDWGKPEAQRIAVCVHGLTRNARDFDMLAERLANTGRRVLALTMPGRGDSDWLADPTDYHYGTYVTDCLRVLDNFHIREVEWIGTSMGGIIGMMIAAAHPKRIRKLVLNDIGALLSKEALSRIYAYVRAIPAQFASREEAEAYLRESFAPWGIRDAALWQRFVETSLQTREGLLRYACDPAIAVPLAAASENFTRIEDVNLSAIWQEIQVPTLILRGAESDILSEDTVRAMRSTNLKAQSMTIPAVGHAPSLMVEAEIKPILEWLDRRAGDMITASF
jgi:pimeloyl-ACP methyl ester carboxylesterase